MQPPSDQGRWLKWAAWASVPVLLYALTPRSRKARRAGEVLESDFDSFLVHALPTPAPREAAAKGGGVRVTDFDAFLKDQDEDDPRNPVDFSSFLKTAIAPKSGDQALAQPKQAAPKQEERPTPSMAPVLLLFGTEYGFSKEIAELLATKLKETKAFWPTLIDMAARPDGYDFSKEQAALVVCSTQGDGVPPNEARDFCDWLFAGKAGPLSHLHFSVCALGDRSYTHYCKCGKTIDTALEKAGAQRAVPRQDVNKEDWTAINDWISALLQQLPSLGLKSFQDLGGLSEIESSVAEPASAPKRWGKSRPFPASVVAIEGLCSVSGKDDKNTVRVEFDLGDSGLVYLPGDALGIYASNDSNVVDDLLGASGLSGSALVDVPAHHYEEEQHVKGGKLALSAALSKCYDLRSPKPDILKLLASLQGPPSNAAAEHAATNGTNGTAQAAALAPPLSALQADAGAQEAYFSSRHVADVLRDFLPKGAGLGAEQLLKALRPLQPRLYSISSSPLEHPQRVQATIAEVKYESLGLSRAGVCSTYVSERVAPGCKVPVFISKNPDFRLPEDAGRPIVMVGPGTGLAPFRAFIKHRLLEGAKEQSRMVLFFGCRRRDQDYLYGSLLDEWAEKGDITLLNAFSREQAQKVYVQQRLRESADLVWQLLHEQHGHFYVCGDASSMAGAVEKELLQIFESRLGSGPEAAAKYLEQLSQQERYQRDVWV